MHADFTQHYKSILTNIHSLISVLPLTSIILSSKVINKKEKKKRAPEVLKYKVKARKNNKRVKTT